MNLWKLYNGKWVINWDHPELIETQELQGPPDREAARILYRDLGKGD